MKKPARHPVPKSATPAEEKDEALADRLAAQALVLRDAPEYAVLPDPLRKAQSELRRIVRKCLQQGREQVLDEALEHCYDEDPAAYRVLRTELEDLSGTLVHRREDGKELEVNAFVVPFFTHATGGLRQEQCFQDEAAFEQLRESFREGGLESRAASVVLVSHAYHLDEIERIGYCHLHEMVQEAFQAMTRRKATAADAIVRSMSGWPPSAFAPDDTAMELRFLLGFALKNMDDPFYRVPEKEAAADRYFEARAARFRAWSEQAQPLLRRCLVTDGRDTAFSFLYQDVFHGGKEAAVNELEMLRVLADLRQTIDEQGLAPDAVAAIVGPTEADDGAVLRIELRAKDGDTPIGHADKLTSRMETPDAAMADIADGLDSLGVTDIRAARLFDTDGMPTVVRPYRR